MKNHIKTVVATFAVVTLTFGSCKKALIEKPYDFISTAQLGSSEKDAEYFVNGALNTINSGAMWGYGAFPKVLELDSDDATGPDWGMGDYGAGNFSSFWGMNAMWAGPYMLIQRSNFGLSRVEAMNINQEMKNNVLGQLNFLKAWGYFLLVRAYGPVPLLKKSIVDGENPQQGRASVKDVYDYIVETLKLAEGQLYSVKSPGYIKGRISKGAASTLLAKVYLTMASGATAGAQITVLTGPAAKIVNGKTVRINKPVPMTFTKEKIAGYDFDATQYFTLARDKAKEVMDSGDYNLFPHFMDVWTVANRNSVEHIWSMQALSNDATLGNGTSVDYVGIFKSPISDISKDVPQVTNGKWYGIRDHWYELFDDNDERINEGVLHRWQDGNGYYQYYPGKDSSVVKGTDTSPRANALRAKYGYQTTDNYGADAGHICALRKFMGVTNPTIDRQDFHFPFLRYADVLLMYAEAENELNGPAGAKAALKQVRTRSQANNDVVDAITDKQAFRSFVLEERRRELALEANRRWDLLRWGIYEQVMNAVDIDENSVLKRRQDKHLLYPIPGEEISSNPLIPINNPGW